LARPVQDGVSRKVCGDLVADTCRGVGVLGNIVGVVAKGRHARPKRDESIRRVAGQRVTLRKNPVGGITDRLTPRRGDVGSGVFDVIKIPNRIGIIGRPGVIHCCRQVKEITRVDGRVGEVNADRRQDFLIPYPGDAVRRHGAMACHREAGQQEEQNSSLHTESGA
jgi:hypothetical protein